MTLGQSPPLAYRNTAAHAIAIVRTVTKAMAPATTTVSKSKEHSLAEVGCRTRSNAKPAVSMVLALPRVQAINGPGGAGWRFRPASSPSQQVGRQENFGEPGCDISDRPAWVSSETGPQPLTPPRGFRAAATLAQDLGDRELSTKQQLGSPTPRRLPTVAVIQAIKGALSDMGRVPRGSPAYRAAAEAVRRGKNELARRFAAIRGWRIGRHFDLRCLARRGRLARAAFPVAHHHEFDHPYFFRDASGRAAAIASHLYGYDASECLELAERFGLTVSVVRDFPSWHFPGRTTLVLWQPRAARDGDARETPRSWVEQFGD